MLARLSLISTAVVGLGLATSAQAAVLPSVEFTWLNAQGATASSRADLDASAFDENNSLILPVGTATPLCEISIDSLSFTVNPSVGLNINVKNNSNFTQTFTFTVTLPVVPPITPSTLVGGSVGGSVTDENFDGTATVSTVSGTPLYSGLIDGNTVLSLHGDPSSWTTFATTNIDSVSAGLPGPTIPGPAAFTSIGIRYEFTLTPGDTAGLTGNFIVIPEPASLSLLAVGGLALLRRSRVDRAA